MRGSRLAIEEIDESDILRPDPPEIKVKDTIFKEICGAVGLIDAEKSMLDVIRDYRLAYIRSLCNELTVWEHRLRTGDKNAVLWEIKNRINELENTIVHD